MKKHREKLGVPSTREKLLSIGLRDHECSGAWSPFARSVYDDDHGRCRRATVFHPICAICVIEQRTKLAADAVRAVRRALHRAAAGIHQRLQPNVLDGRDFER